MKELDAIEARAKAATAGVWEWDGYGPIVCRRDGLLDPRPMFLVGDDNAAFITASRGDVLRLVAALRYAVAELQRIDVEEYSGACDDFSAKVAEILRGEGA